MLARMADFYDMPDWCLSSSYPLDERQQPKQSHQQGLCFRQRSPQEKRGLLTIDQFGVNGFTEVGHGTYTHFCPIPTDGFTTGQKPPQHEEPVIIALTQPITQRNGGDLWPQHLLMGQCLTETEGRSWYLFLPRWMLLRMPDVPVERTMVRAFANLVMWLPTPRQCP